MPTKQGGAGTVRRPRTLGPVHDLHESPALRQDGSVVGWMSYQLGTIVADLVSSGMRDVESGGRMCVVLTVTTSPNPDPYAQIQVLFDSSGSKASGPTSSGVAGFQVAEAREVALAPKEMEFLQRVAGAIEARISDDELDVASLARALHISPSQLGRRLRALVNQSPAEFIRRMRLHRACHLIRESHAPFSFIANACGFSDQAHLCRTLRRYLGTTPSALRKASRQGGGGRGRAA